MCLFNEPIASNCYSNPAVVGGSIDVTVVKPIFSYSDVLVCPFSPISTLFVAEFEISSSRNPTINPTSLPISSLEDTFAGVEGAPLYALFLVVVCYLMYGVILIRLRDTTDNLSSLKLSRTCLRLGLFGSNITAEFAYIVSIFRYPEENLTGFAAVILIARLSHVLSGTYIISKLTRGKLSSHYLTLADKEHLLIHRSVYIPLFLSILVDNTNTAYLPWLSTKFSSLSEGFPDIFIYRTCTVVRTSQSFISTIMQIAVLGKISNNNSGGFSALSIETQVLYSS